MRYISRDKKAVAFLWCDYLFPFLFISSILFFIQFIHIASCQSEIFSLNKAQSFLVNPYSDIVIFLHFGISKL